MQLSHLKRPALRTLFGAFLTLVLAFAATTAQAQSDNGRVVGTVADTTGALIPGATVTLTNTDQNTPQTRTSGPDGSFTFPSVLRGTYRIQVAQPGFAKQTQDFILRVSQVQTIEFKLAPGSESTSIEVTDAAPVVELATSSTGSIIKGEQVTDLPVNGRNFTQLALLTPGVTRGGFNSDASGRNGNTETFRYNDSGGAALSVNGLRAQSNNFLLDGLDNNESLVNTIVIFPPLEAIQEFRVTTSVAPAEFGRAGGAIVNTSVKSGTNQIHGSAFGFYRSSAFGANPIYFGAAGNTKPNLQRKQYGATLGGPLWKNKIFLFGDYQALRQKKPNDAGFHTVPTTLMRSGNFSELLGKATTTLPDAALTGCATVTANSGVVYATTGSVGNLNAQQIYNASPDNGGIFDPATCRQFTGNVIPSNRANAAGLNYLKAYDNPTRTGILQNYFVVRTQVQNYNDADGRLDFHISQKDSAFARFSYAQDNLVINSLFTALPAGFASGVNPNHPRGVAAGYTRLFTDNLVNEFRFGFTRPQFAYTPPFEGTPVSANLGIVNANRNALLGGGALIGGNNNEIEYTGDYGPYSVPEKTYQYNDALTYTHGKHTYKAGVNFIQREVDFFQGNAAKGSFVIGGTNYPGTGRFTGYEISELLAGFSDYQIGAASTYFKTHNLEMGFFAQDDWKISPRLTLNLGVRYDLYTYPYEENNNQANYNIPSGTLLLAGQNGASRSLVNTDKNNFAPRIGFAYDLTGDGKTSLRGGFGLFYFLDRGGIGNQLSNNPGYNGQFVYQAANGYRITLTGQNAQNTNNSSAAQTALPLPPFGPTPALAANPINTNLIAQLPNNQNGTVTSYNLQLQRQLDRATSFTIAYVGTKGDHLMTWFNLNNPILGGNGSKLYPNRSNIQEGLAGGTSHYNSLQLSLNRNVAKDLTLTTAYTWSHTLDNSNGAFSTGTSGAGSRIFITPQGPNLRANYGNSDQDQRHVFVASALYRLPFGRGQHFGRNAPRLLDEVIGGWQINPLITIASGTPIDFSTGGTPDNRPDLISYSGSKKATGRYQNNVSYFNATFALPPSAGGVYTRPGTLSRNFFFGPGYSNVDVSAFKGFSITDRFKAEFRAQAFNVLNHPQFSNPDTYIPDGLFNANGTYSTATGKQLGTINGTRFETQRAVELALHVNF